MAQLLTMYRLLRLDRRTHGDAKAMIVVTVAASAVVADEIDILAEEVIRRSPAWRCTIIGGVLEQDCDALFAMAISRRD